MTSNRSDTPVNKLNSLGESFRISTEGLSNLLKTMEDQKYPGQNILWTDNLRVELPIRIQKTGIGSVEP